MLKPITKTRTAPGWQLCTTATIAYCQVGQHFIEANEKVYRYYETPLRSIAAVCVPCARKETA